MKIEKITVITSFITSIVATATLAATFWFHHLENYEKLLEHRRVALLLGLQVIDNVFSNEPLENGVAPNPHDWDIQLARDADNQIRIYCQYPKTHDAFIRALGLYNPAVEARKGISVKALDEFRQQIAQELDIPEPKQDATRTWIGHLAGAK